MSADAAPTSSPGRYRKRPVVVEAVQLTWGTWGEMCDFAPVGRDGCRGVYVHPTDNAIWADTFAWQDARIGLLIPTLEGDMLAVQDDWVIKGTQGEFYPCKPGPFADAYEPEPLISDEFKPIVAVTQEQADAIRWVDPEDDCDAED